MNDQAKPDSAGGLTQTLEALRPETGATLAATGNLDCFVTLRMVTLFGLMRRAGVLARRRQFGLSETEWRIMTQVQRFRHLSLNRLAELLVQDRGQLSRAVKAMVGRGLLTRRRKQASPEIEIDLTPAGEQLYVEMVAVVIARDRQLTDGIPEGDVAALRRVTEMMIDRAEAILEAEIRQS